MTISRDLFLRPIGVKREKVDLPEFGEGAHVFVYGLTSREKNEHESSLMNAKWTGVDKVKAVTQKERLMLRAVRDESGNSLFSMEDVDAISQWPADITNRLFDVADRLSGGKSLAEGAEKNSE